MKTLRFPRYRTAAALLSLTMCAHAGFDAPRHSVIAVPLGATDADKEIMEIADARNLPYPPVNVPVPPGDMMKLRAHRMFAGKSDVQIYDKVVHMRRAVLCAIDLINKEDARIGEGMRRLFRAGKLCIGLAPESYHVGAEILNDGKVEFNMEPVNFYVVPCERLHLWSPAMFELVSAIGHEGLHGVQEVTPWRNGQPLVVVKNIHCKELEASEAELRRATEMLRVLDAIANTGNLPADARGMTATIGATLIRDFTGNTAGRNAAIAALRATLERIKLRASVTAEFRRLYKRAAELAIAGSPDVPAILAELKKHQLFEGYGMTNEFAPITRYYISNAPQLNETPGEPPKVEGNSGMRQIVPPDPVPREFICPHVHSICDAEVVENANGNVTGIYIGGVNNTDGKGVIVHAGIGADGFIIPASARKLFELPALGAGFNLALNPFDKKLYATNLSNGGITRFDDTNNDGDFDAAVPAGGFAGLPLDKVTLNIETFFAGPDQIIARPGDWDTVRLIDDPFFEAVRSAAGANFMPQPAYPFYEFYDTAPAIESVLSAGSDVLALSGTPGAAFSVRTGGPNPVTLATGRLSFLGRERMVVPWNGSDAVFVEMTGSGVSLPVSIDRTAMFPSLEISGLGGDDTINLTAHAPAGSMVSFFRTDFSVPPVRTAIGMPGYADLNNRFSITVPPAALPDGSGFFVAGVAPPALMPAMGANDNFFATPGLRNNFDVSLNDSPPPGAIFKLGEKPDLPDTLFQFHGDGACTIIPRNASGQLNFTYRIQFGGNFSPFYNVIVGRDIAPLNDPPVLASGGGPMVNVWMLDPTLAEDFPLYQFNFAFSIFDNCGPPHWHAPIPVFSLQDPDPLPDPNPPSCGFGTYPELEPYSLLIPLSEWEAFRAAHP